MAALQLIAFDADDTLWHNEMFYIQAKSRLKSLLAPFGAPEDILHKLDEVEAENISLFGYGIKSFTLSMIEAAIQISSGQVSAEVIQQIIASGKEMLRAEMQPFPGVEATLAELSQKYPLMVITKGDLLDQEDKLARSGLSGYFKFVEIVSEKNPETYLKILNRLEIQPGQFLMVGNSIKSDILPILEIGGSAVYIPFESTWAYELQSTMPAGHSQLLQVERFDQLAGLIRNEFEQQTTA